MLAEDGPTKMRSGTLWYEFVKAFRPHIIRSCSRSMDTEWHDLLTCRGVYIDQDSSKLLVESILKVLYRPAHLLIRESSKIAKTSETNDAETEATPPIQEDNDTEETGRFQKVMFIDDTRNKEGNHRNDERKDIERSKSVNPSDGNINDSGDDS